MNEIKLFNNTQFGIIRAFLGSDGNTLFCLADVCKALDLRNSRSVKTTLMARGVHSMDISTPIISQGVNTGKTKVVQMTFITEPNLYKCIFQSRKKEAEQFQEWVCSEVLPSIRKSGGYMVEKADETPEDLMARALKVANETLARREARLQQLEDTTKAQEQQLKAAAPKVEYVDKVLQSVNTYTVQQIAKELDTTAHKLYEFLKTEKVMFRQSGTWMLNAKYNGKGYTKTRTCQYTRNDGTCCTSAYTVFTEAGRAFIHTIYNNYLNRNNDDQQN